MSGMNNGRVEPGFEGVRDAFEQNFAEGLELGAAFCLYVDGRPVVDLWGGVVDAASGRAYAEDTLQLVFSTTKGATAVCANMLLERGELELDAEVAHYWPEFAQAGKGHVPVRWLLDHRSGLVDVDGPLTLEQTLAWDPVVEALAAQKPLWEPGVGHGYHAITYGYLVGELVRRVSGKSLGRFFADEVATPLGLDFHIGLPASELGRVAKLDSGGFVKRPRQRAQAASAGGEPGPMQLLRRALGAPAGALRATDVFNRPEVLAAEIPAANGVTTARSLARMYAALAGEVDGVRLLSPAQLEAASVSENQGPDRVLYFPMRFGLGFMQMGALSKRFGARAVGHFGAGGSVGYVDPEFNMAFGYTMNRMQAGLVGDPRSVRLIGAVNRAVGKTGGA
ncbi:MAG: beta-lactamase family protein [Myxococcales bacterium]|nr:beta-lactamase family protein [Myxococcales bacterium]